MFYKPNMTFNDSFIPKFEMMINSRLEPIEFTVAEWQPFEVSYLKLSSFRNFIGNVINMVGASNYKSYVGHLFDLNAKITILNQTATKAILPTDLDYIQNPYYEGGGTAYYSEYGKSICLTGPLEDKANRRCLRVRF